MALIRVCFPAHTAEPSSCSDRSFTDGVFVTDPPAPAEHGASHGAFRSITWAKLCSSSLGHLAPVWEYLNVRRNYELQAQNAKIPHSAVFHVCNSLSIKKTSFKKQILRLLRQFEWWDGPYAPPLVSKTFRLLEKVMYWCTYHRLLGTSRSRNQTGVDLPSHGVTWKSFMNGLRGGGPACQGDIPPRDKEEEPSFLCNLPCLWYRTWLVRQRGARMNPLFTCCYFYSRSFLILNESQAC